MADGDTIGQPTQPQPMSSGMDTLYRLGQAFGYIGAQESAAQQQRKMETQTAIALDMMKSTEARAKAGDVSYFQDPETAKRLKKIGVGPLTMDSWFPTQAQIAKHNANINETKANIMRFAAALGQSQQRGADVGSTRMVQGQQVNPIATLVGKGAEVGVTPQQIGAAGLRIGPDKAVEAAQVETAKKQADIATGSTPEAINLIAKKAATEAAARLGVSGSDYAIGMAARKAAAEAQARLGVNASPEAIKAHADQAAATAAATEPFKLRLMNAHADLMNKLNAAKTAAQRQQAYRGLITKLGAARTSIALKMKDPAYDQSQRQALVDMHNGQIDVLKDEVDDPKVRDQLDKLKIAVGAATPGMIYGETPGTVTSPKDAIPPKESGEQIMTDTTGKKWKLNADKTGWEPVDAGSTPAPTGR